MEEIMTTQTKRAPLELDEEELRFLQRASNSRTLPKREIERAQILIFYHNKMEITEIAQKVGIGRPAVYKCIDKAIAMGSKEALKDFPHSPKKPELHWKQKHGL